MASLRNKKGDIEITLFESKGIKATGDVFIIIDLPPNKPFKTHLFKGPDIKIFEKFVLDLMTFQDDEVTLTIKEQKSNGSKFIGQIQIPIKALNLPSGPQWYYLTDRPLKDGQKPKIVTGSLQIQLCFIHRLIRGRSRSTIPKEFFEPPANNSTSNLTTTTNATNELKSNSNNNNNNNYSTVSSNSSTTTSSSSSSSSSSSNSPNSVSPKQTNLDINYGYPVSITVGSNGSSSDILETHRGESINSRYLVPIVPIDDNYNSTSTSTSTSPTSTTTTTSPNIEYSKEEDLIIEETIKDKESIVKKQIQVQKDLLNKLNENIKLLEKQGKPVVAEKSKLKKMQEDIDDMEKLIIVQQSSSVSKSTVPPPQPLQKMPSKGRNLLNNKSTIINNNNSNINSGGVVINKSNITEKNGTVTSSSSSTSTSTSSAGSSINDSTSMNLIHASIFNSGNNNNDIESQLKIFIVELENERRLKESAIENLNLMERDYSNLKRELLQSKSHQQVKSYDELLYKFKILEADNQSLVQEKEILNEKYKLFEKESEKLEKELEYEQSLKRKETEKKEFEREESKKLLKELEQSQSKEKLLGMELETQKELADVMREKKILLEREISKQEIEIKQLKQLKQPNNNSSSSSNTSSSNSTTTSSIEQLQSKIKQLESEIDLEKKSRSILQEKLKLAERDQKLIDRLESEVKRLENQIKSLTNTNESIERERNRAVDSIQKEKDKLEKELQDIKKSNVIGGGNNNNNNNNNNFKNTLTNGTPKQIEEKLNEMVGILVNISQKPDSAAAASIANNQLFDTPLGKKIKEISEKIQTATLKNKEMELNLVELKNSKIQTQLEYQASQILQQQDDNHHSLSKSSSSSSITNSSSSINSSLSNSSNNLLKNSNDNSMIMQNNQISILVSKLEKLDRLEEFIRKLDDMKQFQLNQSSNNLLNNSSNGVQQQQDQIPRKRTHLNMKSEMEEIQKIILSDKVSEKERNDANVKFEKLFQELSMTEEYKKEVQAIQDEKRRLNEPLNQQSLIKLKPIYSVAPLQQSLQIRERIKDNPELSLIGMDSKAILSKHQNDFQSYLLRSLTIDELRAIRASLPKFRSDQKKQIEWTISLEEKIDQVSKQPNQNIIKQQQQKPKVVIKTTKINTTNNNNKLPQPKGGKGNTPQSSSHENLLNELLKRRSKIN